MRHTIGQIRNAPFFPFVPLVPLALAGGLLALEAFVLARVSRLARSVDALAARSAPA